MNLPSTYGYRAVAATASDSVNDPAGPFQAFYVTGAGNVSFDTAAGAQANANLTIGFAANSFIPLRGRRINSTGTTATGIILLYADRF